jgi:hypothetical protein
VICSGTMESADLNFYSRRPLPQSSQHQLPHRIHENPALHEYQSPELPSLTTVNLQAATTNGFAGGGLSGGSDPDAFYREYRGVQSSNGYKDHTLNAMAATSDPPAVRSPPSSFRSNGNGTTPKHPPLAGARQNLKPTLRSVSAPINNDRPGLTNAKSTSALNGNTGKVNVKDMLKRFDQNNEDASTLRKPVPKIVTNQSSTNGPGYMKDRYQTRPTGTTTQTTGTSRLGVLTREAGPGRVNSPTNSRTTQRTRFASEDQHSNNTLSGTARTTRPRNVVPGDNSQASKSMTNLSPTTAQPASQVPPRRPLFGEILPNGLPTSDIGHQIPHTATRRTSDSSLHPSWSHVRNGSFLDTSPTSPTDWYLGGANLEDVDPNKPRSSPGHNRNHSDFADTRVNTMNGVNPSFHQPTPPTRTSSAQPSVEPAKSSTRLPVLKKPPSDSSSPVSTRSNSPLTIKTAVNGKVRKTEQRAWTPVGRSTTPTSRTMTPINRTTTPTHSSPRSNTRSPELAAKNKSSLNAYISAPPLKTSPPLRSSRPRQPVSSATTASSRQKAIERSGSPQKVRTGMKITRNNSVDEPKPRKISDAPVDFAERRLTIKRAYTNRIQEHEQRKIRADNLRRLELREAQNAADKEMAQAQAQAQAEIEVPLVPEPPTRPSPAKPLQISTSFPDSRRAVELAEDGSATALVDSPTLGIPGSFVDDEPPASAISNVTGVTDIDNEPQTEAAFKHLASRPMSTQFIEWNQLSPEQASFGIDHSTNREDGTIQMMLDASPAEELPQQPTPTNDLFAQASSSPRDPSLPGAFKRDSEYVRLDFTTAATIAGPKEITLPESRAVSPLTYLAKPKLSGEDVSQMPGGYVQDLDTSQVHPLPDITVHTAYDLPDAPQSVVQSCQPTALVTPSLAMNDVHDYLNTPTTEMDYESSDGYGGPNSSEPENFEPSTEQHPETPGSFHMFRRSHQSAWTDYSVDTTDDSSDQGEHLHQPAIARSDPQKGTTLEELPYPQVTPKHQPQPRPNTTGVPYNAQPSPPPSDTPRVSSPNHHQLPPISTDRGFGFSFSNGAPEHGWPDYAPPPVPDSQTLEDDSLALPSRSSHPPPSIYSRRAPSSIYQSSQNGTSRNTESRRASDDVYSPRPSISTPRSSTQISLEEAPSQAFEVKEGSETEEDREAAEKTKRRLRQRRNIIQEMIDTESVYLKDMNVVEEIYKGTAEACPKLDAGDIKIIFRNSHEIVAFSTMFLEDLKTAGSSVYSPRTNRSKQAKAAAPTTNNHLSTAATLAEESDEQKDLKTSIGATVGKHLSRMQTVFTDFLKNQELATERLVVLQKDAAVNVWLTECNTVAKDLTTAWDLDALLVKPVQRITRYRMLLSEILDKTPETHPDYKALQVTCNELLVIISGINELKNRLKMVGAIVGRKRKESDVRSGLAKAFGRRNDRNDKFQLNVMKPEHEDDLYVKLHEKYGDDFLRLQVVLRDVEFYTRQIAIYVNDFLRILSSMELFMRLSPSPYPELESKWARFNMSMRDMGTVALDRHVGISAVAFV